MAHTIQDKSRLLDRIRRIRGQVDAIEKALSEEKECAVILHRIAAARGAMNSLMSEVLEGHVRYHIADPDEKPQGKRSKAVKELLDVIKTYLR